MTQDSPPATPRSAWLWLGWTGGLLCLLVILLGVVFPFFFPPLLKWPSYLRLYQPIWWPAKAFDSFFSLILLKNYPLIYGPTIALLRLFLTPMAFAFLLGPWLALVGFFRHLRREPASLHRALQQVLGCQLLFVGLAWNVWQDVQIAQMGWMAWRHGVYHALIRFQSLVWAPFLLAMGIALLTQPERRNRLGIVFGVLSYHALLLLGFFLYYAFVMVKLAPLNFEAPTRTQLKVFGWTLGGLSLVLGIVGTLLMQRGLRIRFHLLLTTPIWLPFFVVGFFWNLIINTTLYFFEEIFGVSWHPPQWFKILVLSWVCIPCFPLFLTADFGLSLMRFFGQTALDHFLPPPALSTEETFQEIPQAWVISLGALLLLTMPIWFLPASLYWGARLFIYEALLQPLLGRPQTPHIIPSNEDS